MKLTDLMLQKLQIALHMKLFKYVSQVLSKNQMNFECEFSQLPLFYRYTIMPIVPDRARIIFSRTNVENYLHTFVLERKSTRSVLCVKTYGHTSGNYSPRRVSICLYIGKFHQSYADRCRWFFRESERFWYKKCWDTELIGPIHGASSQQQSTNSHTVDASAC